MSDKQQKITKHLKEHLKLDIKTGFCNHYKITGKWEGTNQRQIALCFINKSYQKKY